MHIFVKKTCSMICAAIIDKGCKVAPSVIKLRQVFALCKRTHLAKYLLPNIHCQRNVVRGNVALLIIWSMLSLPILITVLYSTGFRCTALLILTSAVPGVIKATIGIEQKRQRSLNDIVLLVFKRLLITVGMYLVVSKPKKILQAIFSFISCNIKIRWLHQMVRR